MSDFSAEGEPQAFDVLQQGRKVARVEWALSGVHNQLNALAAIAAAAHVGVAPAVAAASAGASFQNVKRRMELRGTVRGIAVYDDLPTTPRPCAPRSTACAAAWSHKARILAAFEPRSNTMKLGAMKAQLPWAAGGRRPGVLPHRRAGLGRQPTPWPRWA